MLGLALPPRRFRMAIDGKTLPLPEAAISYRAGDIVAGKYRLERVLGEGGMGTVWAARNTALDALVAVKLIAGTDRASLSARLLKEARAAARLRHPAIVRVFDVGETQHGEPFIVMELLEGGSLADRLDLETTLEPIAAVRLLLPIAEALSNAHAAHIVHRDLKPDNVFIADEDGRIQPKLLDFGIVHVGMGPGATRLTEHGEFVGTPAYMSPEQALGGEDIGRATDVWSFSVVLYECLSGRLPFSSEGYNALMREIIDDTPPTLAELGAGDARLSKIVEIGMAKEPAQRWSSMKTLGAALAEWLVDQGVDEDATLKPLRSSWGLDDVERAARAPAVAGAAIPARQREFAHRGTALFLVVGAVLVALGTFIGLKRNTNARTGAASAQEPSRVVAPALPPQTPSIRLSHGPNLEGVVGGPATSSAPPVSGSSSGVSPRSKAPRVPQTAPRPNAPPARTPGNDDALDLVDPY
jgi:eukaryotic-like serine/threonine-protein kinase